MKGYYEKFCYEVHQDSNIPERRFSTQKSILTYDEIMLNFFINTSANFVYEGCFISLCTVV